MYTEQKLFAKPIIEFNGKPSIEMPYGEALPITFKIELLEDITEPLQFQLILTNGEVDKVAQNFEMPIGKKKSKFTKEIQFDFATTVYDALINWALLIDISYKGQNVCRGNVLITTYDKTNKYQLDQGEDSDFFDLEELEEMEEIEEFEEGEEEEQNEEEEKIMEELRKTKLTPEIMKTLVKNVVVMQISEGIIKVEQQKLDE